MAAGFMTRILGLVSLCLLSAVSVHAAVLAGPVYNPQTTHSYYLLTSSSWTVSEAEAVTLGGHLVTVNDAMENNWLLSTFSNFGNESRALWTGLSDQVKEGYFIWSSGENSLFRNWEMGQPDDGGGYYPTEDYVLIWPSPGPRSPGMWNDYIDSNTFPDMSLRIYGVVEVPEPSWCGLLLVGGAMVWVAAGPRRMRSPQER